jgi:cell division protein FtsQ
MRRRLAGRALVAAAALLILAAGAFIGLRNASMFAVEEVAVRGASGPDAPKVEAALRDAARGMTTLNVRRGQLERVVAGFPTVAGVEIDRDLPNGLDITVVERRPVAVVEQGGRRVPLSADGRLLRGATPPDDVPALAVDGDPGDRVDDREGRALVAVVAAAPQALRSRARRAVLGDKGLTLHMVRGPELYFGPPTDLRAKWKAVARVLADPTSEGATYVDVRVPDRAAAGGLAAPAAPEEPSPGASPGTVVPDPSTSTGA